LILVLLVTVTLLPVYVAMTWREVRQAEAQTKKSELLASKVEADLKTNKELLRRESKALMDVKEELSQKKSALALADEKFQQYQDKLITCDEFARAVGQRITSPTDRGRDVANRIRKLSEQKNWSEATKIAKGWLEFHRSSPSSADNGALIEIALLWKRLAEAGAAHWGDTPYKSKQELLAAANELFEEVAGKASGTTVASFPAGRAYIAGNWGTVLMDMAKLLRTRAESERVWHESAHLLDIAIEMSPRDDVWRLNRIYVEGLNRKSDPSGFASYCEALKPKGKPTTACGRVLYGLTKSGRLSLPAADVERLVCQAARWAREDVSIQKDCEQARQRIRRRESP